VSERSTEQLVHELAQDVPPVRPIPCLRRVMAAVVIAWVIAVALMWLLSGLPPDLLRSAPWGDPKFTAVLVGLGCMALGATLAAGGGLWALVGTTASPGEMGLTSGLSCMGRACGLALLPVLVASLFLARGFAHRPLLSAGFAVAGSVALGALVVHASCRMGGALHVLLGHALAPLLLGFVLAIPIGLLVRHWNRRT
jgi:hypothetical protein